MTGSQAATSTPNDQTAPRRDYQQEVTNQIIEMLEKGTAPWQKPWDAGALNLPFNPTSGRNYRGGNALHLMAAGANKGYEDPRWLTYRQAQENGWQVRQGEKGTQIEYWQFDDRASKSGAHGSEERPGESEAEKASNPRRGLIFRVYTVFNAKQIDGIPDYTPKQRLEWEVAATGEQILHNSDAKIVHDQRDRAFYNRAADDIHLPRPEAFRTAADYYGTALHELAHWAGHPSRLNRQTLNESYRFGDPNYAKEELRAELTSVFLAAERGIPHNPEQHAAYLGSWIEALKNDKNEIFRAAKDAHVAADYILGLEREKAGEHKQLPQLWRETSEHVAAYERVTGTVNVVEKQTAMEDRNLAPVGRSQAPDGQAPAKAEAETILDGEVDGRRPRQESDLQRSLTEAEVSARERLGTGARVYSADLDSGRYRGELIGETEHHVVQKIGAKSAVTHPKHLLPESVATGQNLSISYSNGNAQAKPFKAREKTQALSR